MSDTHTALGRASSTLASPGDPPPGRRLPARHADLPDQASSRPDATWVDLTLQLKGRPGQELRGRLEHEDAARELVWLLSMRGDEAGLARRASTGDRSAALALARLLRERGDEAWLARRADAGDRYAANELGGLLRDRNA
jgi:hypothetical protein